MIRKWLHKKYIVYSVTIVKWLYDAFFGILFISYFVMFQMMIGYHFNWYGVVM